MTSTNPKIPNEKRMSCPHEFSERSASLYLDGLCPICLYRQAQTAREEFKKEIKSQSDLYEKQLAGLKEKLHSARDTLGKIMELANRHKLPAHLDEKEDCIYIWCKKTLAEIGGARK